jgi:Skp family chaperone for outer membrane proteins
MGVERAVTRWYLQRQAYQNEITALEAKLAAMRTGGQKPESKEQTDVEKQLVNAQSRLRTLGPCPKAMMG